MRDCFHFPHTFPPSRPLLVHAKAYPRLWGRAGSPWLCRKQENRDVWASGKGGVHCDLGLQHCPAYIFLLVYHFSGQREHFHFWSPSVKIHQATGFLFCIGFCLNITTSTWVLLTKQFFKNKIMVLPSAPVLVSLNLWSIGKSVTDHGLPGLVTWP